MEDSNIIQLQAKNLKSITLSEDEIRFLVQCMRTAQISGTAEQVTQVVNKMGELISKLINNSVEEKIPVNN